MSWRAGGLLLLVMLGLFLIACQETAVDACDGNGALFADDFSGAQDCGWATYERNGAAVEIADGALVIRSSQPGQIWWTNPGREFADTSILVNAQVTTGPEDNAYGVICRYRDSENYYLFLISGDGYYAIGRYQSGSNQITYLTGAGEYTFSEAINQGSALNQMRVSCAGSELTLSVNGIELDRIMDTSYSTGDIGLAAGTFQPGTLEVHFTDLRVVAP